METQKVVIIGAGFAGLKAAKTLSGHKDVEVTLIDQKNYHLFQPLLYQVATAGLNPSDIAIPIRSEFKNTKNVAVHLGAVDNVQLKEKWISAGDQLKLPFDYLVLACGVRHSYFGKNEWEEHAPGLKTLEQATEIRSRILNAFEMAENQTDPVRQSSLLTFIVVGGGPTGVELAGAIADICHTVFVKDFKRIRSRNAKIILLEASPRILPQFIPGLSAKTMRALTQMGVEVKVNSKVTRIDEKGVEVNDFCIASESVFWAAGVQAAEISQSLNTPLDKAGRIIVNEDLSIPEYPNVFAVGDLAHLSVGEGRVLPGIAPAAMQTGTTAAKNILASIRGQPRTSFKYRDKGQMATIRKHRAVAQSGKIQLSGFVAWLAWLFIHILYLTGFKNRFAVFFQWVWCYLFSKRGSRLITQKDWKIHS